jgi:hypothetical protein
VGGGIIGCVAEEGAVRYICINWIVFEEGPSFDVNFQSKNIVLDVEGTFESLKDKIREYPTPSRMQTC